MVEDNFEKHPTQIRGSFHNLLKHCGIMHIFSCGEAFKKDYFYADFVLLFENEEYHAGLSKGGAAVNSSYEYDESDVLEGMIVNQDSIKMVFKTSYTYIEQIVAMTKRLHAIQYPEVKEKWLFTKFRFLDKIDPRLFPGGELLVKAGKNFRNMLTQNTLALDSEPIGDIWFSASELQETK
jgi:hypothetical protein